mmetsp:Transcript_21147/g.58548  ORF Transcript_21147/g.58548 Transcript_21147/m.58548 type:complete len:204 (+) Transcript_21147:1028-1639(+)
MMMKTAAVFATTLLASAAAFAPASQTAAPTALCESPYSNEVGVQAPTGLFDPFGLLEGVPQEGFDKLRYIELKHGRVAMLAVVGYLTTAAGIRFPGAGDVPDGLKAFSALAATEDGKNVLLQMTAFFALAEIVNRDIPGTGNEFPGDFRNGAIDYGWANLSDETKLQKRAIELNNGRAAQMGLLGLMVHDKLGNIETILPYGN